MNSLEGLTTGAHSSRRSLVLRGSLLAAAGALLSTRTPLALADTVHMTTEQFLQSVFGNPPKPSVLWLTPEIQRSITTSLGHPYHQARIRYWRDGPTTCWILDEIGKEFPITAGFAIRDGVLLRASLLVYRESRGDEIGQRSFLRQFEGARLDPEARLTRRIDGITGASMSVDAMDRMARTALVLDAEVSR